MSEDQQRADRPGGRRTRDRRGSLATSPRTAVLWSGVEQVLSARGERLDVLDLGGGTGGLAVAVAGLGHQVVVVDPSPDALAAFERRASDAGVADRVRAVQGDADDLPQVVGEGSQDVVLCHGVLEHVDDPADAIRRIAATLRPGGAVSLLVAQRLAAVLGRALAGRFAEASRTLASTDGRWGEHDPLPRRFDAEQVVGLLEQHGLRAQSVHGLRVFADLVPEVLVDGEDARDALRDLERLAGEGDHPVLTALAAQLHVVAVRDR